jgi:DivIVA domain-containing protein
MPMTPEDVRDKEFTTVRLHLGYDMDEVDAFLDEVEAELSRRDREHQELTAKANKAAAAYAGPAPMVGPAPAPTAAAADQQPQSGSAVKVLELAQRTADEHVATAKAEAEKMVAEAEEKRRTMIAEGEEKRRTMIAEAEEKRRKVLSSLEAEQASLQSKVDDLRNFEREYHTRLKDYIQGQLRDLDARPDDAAVPKPVAAVGGAPAGPQGGDQQG